MWRLQGVCNRALRARAATTPLRGTLHMSGKGMAQVWYTDPRIQDPSPRWPWRSTHPTEIRTSTSDALGLQPISFVHHEPADKNNMQIPCILSTLSCATSAQAERDERGAGELLLLVAKARTLDSSLFEVLDLHRGLCCLADNVSSCDVL